MYKIAGLSKNGGLRSAYISSPNRIGARSFKRQFLIKPLKTEKPKSKYRAFKIGVGLGLAGTVAYYTNDTAKHSILIAERIGVVSIATIRCFKLYADTLRREYPNTEERYKELSATHQKAANITLKALEKNGGIYIKLGQHITALTYLLPKEWTDTMIPLQDRCPVSSMDEIEDMFKKDLGLSISDIFSEFSPEPIGAASLAQVHIAKLKDTDKKVAVKVQHPSLQEFVPLDIFLTKTVFNLMYKFFPEYPLTWLGDELQNSIYVELDFENEARNARKTKEDFNNFQKLTALRIPEVLSANKRILIMEFVTGARLDDLEFMKKHNISTSDVSSCLSHIFNCMIFAPGFGLHCDPHGGNIAIRPTEKPVAGHNFEIILYDHGLYRDIPVEMKRNYAHFWLSVLDNDVPKMREYSEKFAGIHGEQKFRIFAAAITGRSPDMALNYDISKVRTSEEMQMMQQNLQSGEGILEDLMTILSTMPRMVLLILKTNDLTRNLDEGLNNPLGPERTFLILANYCARTIYDEALEKISFHYKKFSIGWIYRSLTAWVAYHKRISSLYVYDCMMLLKRITPL